MKNYILVNRRTGKVWRKAATRDEARMLKRSRNFQHNIVNQMTGQVVR